ncbi:MAG TPA: AAA family ATPase [Chloroflexota bacterium]|nr:AAA family ATPase [Chloroflexota bacterium]
MKRVLITGMSGTGKSTVIRALAARGYKAVDLDSGEWSHWVPMADDGPADPPSAPGSAWQNHDWVWREDRVAVLLADSDAEMLFVGGTAANQGRFHPDFDHIVLLSAPVSVLVARLASRATNDYGKDPDELARVLQHVDTVEPLLRRAASLEIDTRIPLDDVVDAVESVARS